MFASNYRMVSFRILILFAWSVLCWSCAQQGSPTGGPRDEVPPRVTESDPPNYSTRFASHKIMITFDEFIVVENVNQELIVSPPMEEKPDVKLKKKTIVIEFEEELKENTTYTFNFGRAIKDLHEGNILMNFEYVFSTGDVLDSMSVRGILRNAEDLSYPEDPVSIMLYRDLGDSVPLKEIPLYVGRSADSGIFSINNLSPDVYKVFALKDGNNNLLFDLPTEEIAFLDTALTVNAELARNLLEAAGILDTSGIPVLEGPVMDSVNMIDTISAENDTLDNMELDLNAIYIDLYLFAEETEIQYIEDYIREDRRRIELTFARPLTDSFRYRFIIPGPDKYVDKIAHFSPGRDSLILWLTDSVDYKLDTLAMEVGYMARDTAGRDQIKFDTLQFIYRERKETRRRGERETQPVEQLKVSALRNNGTQELNRDLAVTIDLPLKEIHDSLIGLYRMEDSVEIPVPFVTSIDSSSLYRGWIRTDWQSDSRYRLSILPGALSSIYPVSHDTVNIQFKTRDSEYYGQILLDLESVDGPVIIELTNKNKIVRRLTVNSSGQVEFPFLKPQEYRIKIIHDRNGNGKWDTGNYIKKLQPESVEIMKGSVTVRSNWDHKVTLVLQR